MNIDLCSPPRITADHESCFTDVREGLIFHVQLEEMSPKPLANAAVAAAATAAGAAASSRPVRLIRCDRISEQNIRVW